jgi:3-hydroxy-9,10-secoandrosta-1,3,5(10)-triene-9,17-dione monooxygenase reductase component
MSTSDDARELAHAPIDPELFRSVLGNFASGVTIVTAMDDGEPVGLTAQSFTSLSLDPPLVMFCPKITSTSWPRIEHARHFAANILAEGQDALGIQFARSGGDKFADVEWTPGPTGAPLLGGVLAHIDCTIEAVHPGGDHQIVIGRVLHLAAESDKKPLVYFRSAFESLAPRP